LEQCKKLGAASSQALSTPGATAQSPTFKETLDWLISKNAQEGFTEGMSQGPDFPMPPIRWHSDFVSYSGDVQCVATLRGNGDYSNFTADNSVSINFSAAAPNSIGVKRVNVRNLMPPPQGAQVFSFPQEVYFQITGLHPFFPDDTPAQQASEKQEEFDFTTNPRAPIYFDQDLANRVAKALNHAIDVCGGKGKPEAF
jgi:hypothetical protein